MNIFKVIAEQTNTIETLVMANNQKEARHLMEEAIGTGEIEFDDFGDIGYDVTNCSLIKTDPFVLKEIKDYGILTNEGELVYNLDIEKIEKMDAQKEKEEWLKKTHMEFNFKP